MNLWVTIKLNTQQRLVEWNSVLDELITKNTLFQQTLRKKTRAMTVNWSRELVSDNVFQTISNNSCFRWEFPAFTLGSCCLILAFTILKTAIQKSWIKGKVLQSYTFRHTQIVMDRCLIHYHNVILTVFNGERLPGSKVSRCRRTIVLAVQDIS